MDKVTKELSATEKRILSLWADGLSGSEIAICLGTTKGTIMGKIHRMKKAGIDTGRPQPPRNPKQPKEEKQKRVLAKPKASRTIRVYFPPKPQIKTKPYLTIYELNMSSCRFIVNEAEKDGIHLFCGKKISRGSYCNHHAEICYTPISVVAKRMKQAANYKIGIKNGKD